MGGHHLSKFDLRPARPAACPNQSTVADLRNNAFFSITYYRRTFSGQSGALENVGLRETKIGLAAIAAVRSYSQRSPQILGILDAEISAREICPRAKWRRERRWDPTLSISNLLISLILNFGGVRIPRGDPDGAPDKRPIMIIAS
jgi:hypothetical protein